MALEHIFFDLDNTLWDFRRNSYLTIEKLFIEKKIEYEYGISFLDFYDKYHQVNEQLWIEIRDGLINKDQLKERRFRETFEHFSMYDTKLAYTFEDLYLDEIIQFSYAVEGAQELLEHLHGKFKLHILSNGFQEVTHRKVQKSNWTDFFETITSADEIGKRKPHSDIFFHALQKANATPETSILIGDDVEADVDGATQIGMPCIFFYPFDGEFPKVNTDLKVRKLMECEVIINKLKQT